HGGKTPSMIERAGGEYWNMSHRTFDPARVLFRADLEARSFRARGESIYPGKIIVIRGGSFFAHAVEDADLDLSREGIMGIAFWGCFEKWSTGLVRTEPVDSEKSVLVISGRDHVFTVGVPLIDTWVARADAFRGLLIGRTRSFGGIPLTEDRSFAAAVEVARVIRLSAVHLLTGPPRSHRQVLLAMAMITDIEILTAEVLTAAIRELLASSEAWKESVEAAEAAEGVATIEDVRPTMQELVGAIGFSSYTFKRIRL